MLRPDEEMEKGWVRFGRQQTQAAAHPERCQPWSLPATSRAVHEVIEVRRRASGGNVLVDGAGSRSPATGAAQALGRWAPPLYPCRAAAAPSHLAKLLEQRGTK
jgi:hypothetical protein